MHSNATSFSIEYGVTVRVECHVGYHPDGHPQNTQSYDTRCQLDSTLSAFADCISKAPGLNWFWSINCSFLFLFLLLFFAYSTKPITGGTLARILARIWFADLLADGEPYYTSRPSTSCSCLLSTAQKFTSCCSQHLSTIAARKHRCQWPDRRVWRHGGSELWTSARSGDTCEFLR